jgi:2'-5' RNA ligase
VRVYSGVNGEDSGDDDESPEDESLEDELPDGRVWRRPAGMFVLGPVDGPAAEVIYELQRQLDPKLASAHLPHVTLTGSSGVGPILAGTPVDQVREALEMVARETPPLQLKFEAPTRFMQTNIVSLGLDPHGPLRALHERIATSGLPFGPVRFTFTPHVTLSFYPTLTRESARRLLALRVNEPGVITRLVLSATADPQSPTFLAEVPLQG